jgi:hypothetical protein
MDIRALAAPRAGQKCYNGDKLSGLLNGVFTDTLKRVYDTRDTFYLRV